MVGRRLEVLEVSKSFKARSRQTATLDKLSFAAEPGSITVLLGPSGSGKTTLLRIIAGLETVSSGSVLLDGKEIRGPGERTVLMFQNYPLFPWLTARQNVMFGLEHGSQAPSSAKAQTATGLLGKVGLSDVDGAYPNQLSGGMRQRVAIARALAVDPLVLLMDEPFSALDSITRQAMHALVLQVRETSQLTIVFVTHDVDDAMMLADTILVLSHRPATIVNRLDVSGARPRNQAWVTTSEFVEMRNQILRSLRDGAISP